jgi:hypothetical protein
MLIYEHDGSIAYTNACTKNVVYKLRNRKIKLFVAIKAGAGQRLRCCVRTRRSYAAEGGVGHDAAEKHNCR